jgi:hypothetical protein
VVVSGQGLQDSWLGLRGGVGGVSGRGGCRGNVESTWTGGCRGDAVCGDVGVGVCGGTECIGARSEWGRGYGSLGGG